jgi:multiple sugar transport system substrate-binding protein
LQELRLATSISNSAQRAAYYDLVQGFEKSHPNIRVKISSYTSELYKTKFPQILTSGKYDLLYWHAGERLLEHIKNNKIAALGSVLSKAEISDIFDTAAIRSVSFNKKLYALPMSYYQIGFYYNKVLFSKFGFKEPRTWQEFLALCKALKANNTTPIYIGTKSNWTATAWFDYLNLRLNGITFQMDLMQGRASYLDNRIQRVFEKLNQLNYAEYFVEGHQNLDWIQGLPLLYRGLVGMMLLGNYAEQNFPNKVKKDIGFFKFPTFNKRQTYFEETPLDVLLIPSKSNQQELAHVFIKYAAEGDNQQQFNKILGVLFPHKDAQQNNSSLIQEAYNVIVGAQGVTQFFDRDSKSHADQAMPIIDAFMINGDITQTQQALEKVRLAEYPDLF